MKETKEGNMTNDELEQKHKALAESVELLAGSTHDLRAIAETLLAREQEQRVREALRWERDSRFLTAIAQILDTWAKPTGEGQ
jgi:hypothetical protein